MELLMPRVKKDKVFLFDGSLGEQVWEAEPITRFRFKKPVENKVIKELLSANHPTAGIAFDSDVYIGTNDGMIYSSVTGKKTQRIPELHVDPELFIDEFPFKDDEEKTAFHKFLKRDYKKINFKKRGLVNRISDIHDMYKDVLGQERLFDIYLTHRMGIRGFVVASTRHQEEPALYDGHMLGITDTKTGCSVNNYPPVILHQINSNMAGFVPSGYPGSDFPTRRVEISDGIEKMVDVPCVDYQSLWEIKGRGVIVRDVCPRNGSGYRGAKFATDGKTVAICDDYGRLDILKRKKLSGLHEKVQSMNFDVNKTPGKLLIKPEGVIGDSGNVIRNFSGEKDLFVPPVGMITSLSDSGLCTVVHQGRTTVYNPLTAKPMDAFEGDYIFLDRAPQ